MTLEDHIENSESGLIDGLQLQLTDFEKLRSVTQMQRDMIAQRDFDDHDRLTRLLTARDLLIAQIRTRDQVIIEGLNRLNSGIDQQENDLAQLATSVNSLLQEISAIRDEILEQDQQVLVKLKQLNARMNQQLKTVNGGQKIRKTYQSPGFKTPTVGGNTAGYGQANQGRFTDRQA